MVRRRLGSLSSGIAIIASLIVSMPAAPVLANDGPPTPDGRRGGEGQPSALPFVEDNNSCATLYDGQSNILLNSANNDLYVGSGQTYSGKVVRANGTAVAGAIVGSIMLSEFPSQDASPVIVAASCAVTDAQGNFSVKVLFAAQQWPEDFPVNLRGGRLVVSPPFSPNDLAEPLTGTLGSYSSSTLALVDTNGSSAGVQLANITLQPANISWGSAPVNTGQFADLSAAPFSAFCIGYDPQAPKTITCGMSRGAKISKAITAIEAVQYNPEFDDWCQGPDDCYDPGSVKYLRVFLASASGFGFANQVKIEGLDGGNDAYNGQYADTLPSKLVVQYCDDPNRGETANCLDGSTVNDFWVDIPLPWDGDLVKTSVVADNATVTAVVWRANMTLANNAAYNTGDKEFFIQGFHSHVIDVIDGAPISASAFRVFPYRCNADPENGGDPNCSTYGDLVNPEKFSVTDFLTEGGGGPGSCPEPENLSWKGLVVVDAGNPPTTLYGCAFWQLVKFNEELGQGGPGQPLTGWDWENQDTRQQGEVKNGAFSITPTAGIYRLNIYPPTLADDDPNNQGATEFNAVIRWTVDGESFDTDTCADFDAYGTNNPTTGLPYEDANSRCISVWTAFTPDGDGNHILTAPIANFKGRALDGETPIEQVYVEVREWNGQYWDGTGSGAGTNKFGQFRTRLEEGVWQLIFRPNPDFSEHQGLAETSFYVKVNNVPTVTCVSTTNLVGATGCPSGITAESDGSYDLPFVEPNFSGYASISSDAPRANAAGVCTGVTATFEPGELCDDDDALENAFVQIQAWNEFANQYQWSPDLQPFNTRNGGSFATNIPVGDADSNPMSMYQVIVEKPFGSDLGEFARSSFNIRLVGGVVVCDKAYTTLSCADGSRPHAADPATPRTGTWDLHLAGANLTGQVTAGEDPVPFADVRAERWNGQWFDWVNLFTNTDADGNYGFNLGEDGTYKISAEPPRWGSGASNFADYSLVSKLVLVDGSDLCAVTDVETTSCDAGANPLTLDLELTEGNVKVLVRDATGASPVGLGNAWVGWSKYNSDLGWWEWMGGSGTRPGGTVSLSIAPPEGDDEMLVRLEVNPPWDTSSTLVRKSVDLVVNDDLSYYQCAEADYKDDSCANADSPSDAGATYTIDLANGNVSGVIRDTAGVQPQQNSWIQVQKWEIPEWSISEVWNWLPIGGNSNGDGEYGIDLADRGTGFFKLTAYPPWSRVNDLTPTSVIVYQNGDDVVTACAGYSDSDMQSPDFNDCIETNLDINLQGPTLLGTLLDGVGGDPVQWAWVGLTKEVEAYKDDGSAAGDADSRSRSWYQWLGGANSNDDGEFGLRLTEPGRYAIEVNPPWNSTLPRFTQYLYVPNGAEAGGIDSATEVYLCANRQQSNDDCDDGITTWGAGSRDIAFASPNVWVKVCAPGSGACVPVTNSWVSVFSEYEWLSGASTNSAGIARFSLEPGDDYRFEANPNWQNPVGSRVETGFKRNDGVDDDDDIVISADNNLITAASVEADTSGNIIDVVNTTYSVLSLRLGSPNVTGSVKYNKAGTPTAMPWAFVSARTEDYSQWYGSPVDINGNYALDLPADETYVLTAYPNPSIAAGKSPVSKTVVVDADGDLVSCGGLPATSSCNFNFDDTPPNVTITINGAGTLTRTWYFFQDTNSNAEVDDTERIAVSVSATPNSSGVVTLNVLLTPGEYVLVPQKLNTVSTDGATPIVDFSAGDACRQNPIVAPAIAAYTFVTNDVGATATGMECES